MENGSSGPAIGVIFDGTGFGSDGTIWGGEFLVGGAESYIRAGHFLPSRLPGGDASVREPWRYALSMLSETLGIEDAGETASSIWPGRSGMIRQVLAILPVSPVTTSCGRFFDGIASLIGLAETVTYDGQAAMALEGVAEGKETAPFGLIRQNGVIVLDWRPSVRWLLEKRGRMSPGLIAGAVHNGLAECVVQICRILRESTGISEAALSGGVWQNRRLTAFVSMMLKREGFVPLLHRLLPPNDECVSVGQVAVGAAMRKKEKRGE